MSDVREPQQSTDQPPSSNAGMGMDVSHESFWRWWFRDAHWLNGYRREWRFLILVWGFLAVVGLATWVYGVERLPEGTADVSMAVAAVVSVLGTLVPNLTNPARYTWLLSRRGVGVMGLLTLFSGVAVAGSYGASIRADEEAAQRVKKFAQLEQQRDEAKKRLGELLDLVGSPKGETSILGRLRAVHEVLGDESDNGVLGRLHDLDARLPSAHELAKELLGPKNGLLPAIEAAAQKARPQVTPTVVATALQDDVTAGAMRRIVESAKPQVTSTALATALQDDVTKNAMVKIVESAKPQVTSSAIATALQDDATKNAMVKIVESAKPQVTSSAIATALQDTSAKEAIAASVAAALQERATTQVLAAMIDRTTPASVIAALNSDEGRRILRELISCQ